MRRPSPRRRPGRLSLGPPPLILPIPVEMLRLNWVQRSRKVRGAPEQYGGRALHDPPVTTAHSGRAEGGFRSAGAPGGAVHGPPLTPPPPPRGGTATPTARARRKGVRRRHEGGQD